MGKRKPTKFTAFLWHRRIGLVALVLVVVTGICAIVLTASPRSL